MPRLLLHEKPPPIFDGGLPRPASANGMTGYDNRGQGSDRRRHSESVATINNEWYSAFRAMPPTRRPAGDVSANPIAWRSDETLDVTEIFSCAL
jgi:hypothetical protein